MEHEWDEVHVKMSDSESVKAFCQRKGADRREKPEKALPKRKGGWKVRGGRVMAGRSRATLASVGTEGRRKPPPP